MFSVTSPRDIADGEHKYIKCNLCNNLKYACNYYRLVWIPAWKAYGMPMSGLARLCFSSWLMGFI